MSLGTIKKRITGGLATMAAVTGLLLSAAAGTQAAVIVIDDPVFGPGTVLRDTDTATDYLRLSLSMGYGYAGIETELGPGGEFDGWGIASTSDMLSLGGSLGIANGDVTVQALSVAAQLRDWFCPLFTCVNTYSTHVYARGLVSDLYTDGVSQDAFSIGERFNVSPPEVDFRISGFGDVYDLNEEVFLVRSSVVPLPATVWMFGSGMLGLALMARRRAGRRTLA